MTLESKIQKTALHIACERGDTEVVRRLLDHQRISPDVLYISFLIYIKFNFYLNSVSHSIFYVICKWIF